MTVVARRWLLGGFLLLLGLIGLVAAAGAKAGGIYYAGLGLFGLAILLIGYLVKRHYDEAEQPHGSL